MRPPGPGQGIRGAYVQVPAVPCEGLGRAFLGDGEAVQGGSGGMGREVAQ